MSHFSSDRFYKYGFGLLRLFCLVCFAFAVAPSGPEGSPGPAEAFAEYLRSWRWLGHAFIGTIGAVVNVSVVSFSANMGLLLTAGAFCVWDVRAHDLSIVVYLMKTMGGDFFAGKLDTREWRLVLFFVFGLLGPAALLLFPRPEQSQEQGLGQEGPASPEAYLRILLLLFCLQLFCEYGDAHLEHFKFFRHRYSYEVTGLALLLLVPLARHELLVVQFDMVICLFYRLSNLSIIVVINAYLSRLFSLLALSMHAFLVGVPVLNVTDPELASLVLRESSRKGEALEKYSSVPAWRPIVSLESEDGPLWRDMSVRFHALLQRMPSVAALSDTAGRNIRALKEEAAASGSVIDANALVKLTIATYLEYALGISWRPEFQLFVEASWEWRKEIAVKGIADVSVKQRTVKLFLSLLKEADNSLWDVYGDKWNEPEYYSLILQPFIISPSINVGDTLVALHMSPPGTSLDTAMRLYHPFPLFERYVDHDISLDGGKTVAIKAHTQVEMFLSDFRDSTKWPVFGAGERICAGRHLAMPFLKLLVAELSPLPNFDPLKNHLYSGRSNDDTLTLAQSLYFVKTIGSIIAERFYHRIRYGGYKNVVL
jgi:hypothetical protein